MIGVRRVVPVLVVVLLLALFFLTRERGHPGPRLITSDDVIVCRDNLRAIHAGLTARARRTGGAPTDSGVAFFATLIADGSWEDTAENRARLTCPGPLADAVPAEVSYRDLASLDPSSSAYAGRDIAAHPLSTFPAGGPETSAIVACDGMNHEGILNVLMSDGSVRSYELARLLDEGRVPAGTTRLTVGPDSPLEDLRVLVAD